MKRLLGIGMMVALGVPSVGRAQGSMGLFHSPVFVAQPGIVRSFADGATTEFNMRFVTALPMSIPRTTLVGIIQWTPFADNGAGGKANSPAFVYGPVINLINQSKFSFDFDALFAYGPADAAVSSSDYTHKFLVEGDVVLKLGTLMNAKGQFGGLGLYGFLAYVLTGLADGTPSGNRTVLLAGLTLPLAPWKK